jgi:heme/copper-type cytochrome/quinol oxidase subunit 3
MKFDHGFTFSKNIFWSYYFLMTGLHALHVIAGMIAMIIVSFGVKKGENLHRVEMVGLYWHFVDIVWIFLFPLLYIAK